jgi:hypothetical protein
MNLGIDPRNFYDPALEPEDVDSEQDIIRQHYRYQVAQIDRQDVLLAVIDALDADDSPLFELIDDELGEPTLPGETVRHNAMVWQRIGKALHTIVAQQIQAKAQVRMAHHD